LPGPNSNGGTIRNRREILTLGAVRAMQAILQDLQILSEALTENKELFAHDQRNFGAQQVSFSARFFSECKVMTFFLPGYDFA